MIRLSAVLIAAIILATAGFAQHSEVVNMHEHYLAAPTDWCPADAGVPVIFSVDGPDVHVEIAEEDKPKRVVVRRGNQDREIVDVGPISSVEVRSRRGVESETLDTRRYSAIDQRNADLIPLGRLSFEMKVCQSLWANTYASGSWAIEAADGTVVRSGETKTPPLYPRANQYFYTGGYPRAFKIDDRFYFVKRPQKFIRTTEAFASPAED